MNNLSEDDIFESFLRLGVCIGDVILIRASLGAVGRITGGANAFINALLRAVGSEGTIVSLAFTGGAFITKPKKEDAFYPGKKSYAGALPNTMIGRTDSFRSRHPMCSYVAIGKYAKEITESHDENSPAYEPVRKIIELEGKCMLVGCVEGSPGFTTAHLAEADLGLPSLSIFPKLRSTYYKNLNGDIKLFRRPDLGFCSNSFYKFYALYVKKGILTTGFIGNAYSISAPAKQAYLIEYETLKNNSKFSVCESKTCFTCNAGRWDRIHKAPGYILRSILKKLATRLS